TVSVEEPDTLDFTLNIDSASCKGVCDGQIEFTSTSGGTTPYEYSIDNGTTYQSNATFSGECAGNYDLKVRDANSCEVDTNVNIDEPNKITFSASDDSVSCKDTCDGTIEFTSVSGGTTPYQYSIDNGANFQGSSTFNDQCKGTYELIVKDDNGCDDSGSVSIEEPSELSFTTSMDSVSCNGACDGKVEVTSVSGGTSPYQYSKDSGASFQGNTTFSNLCDSTYNILVKDDNGCEDTSSVTVEEPDTLTFTTTSDSVSCFGGSDGKITVSASGGTIPYSYSNDSGSTYQSSDIFSSLSADTFGVVVKDDNGCTDTNDVEVGEPDDLTITMNKNDAS
ncbi:MAG: SprB repeat-containing protein, partial [Flavobacteriales bacterium]